jgi:hypothetical protein
VIVALATLLCACAPKLDPTASSPAGPLTVVYSGNVDGDIEPCG